MEEIIFLALTIVVELPVVLLVMPKQILRRVGWVAVCVNMVTHPIGWYVASTGISWILIEIAVALVEMIVFVVLFPEMRKRAVASALCMNVVSAGIGAIFF